MPSFHPPPRLILLAELIPFTRMHQTLYIAGASIEGYESPEFYWQKCSSLSQITQETIANDAVEEALTLYTQYATKRASRPEGYLTASGIMKESEIVERIGILLRLL